MSDLTERLNAAEHPDPDDVTEYLRLRAERATEQGMHVQPIDVFLREDDLGSYAQARSWWPEDAPGNLACPPLTMLLDAVATAPGLAPRTFGECLAGHGRLVTEWLESSGRSVEHPNETADERRRRRNRERVARHRAATATGERGPAALAWDAVIRARRERARVRAEHDELVRLHYVAMTEASEERRRAMEDQDRLVAEAEEAHERAKHPVAGDHQEDN